MGDWESLRKNQGVFGRDHDKSDEEGPYKKGMLWKVHLSFYAIFRHSRLSTFQQCNQRC